MPDQLSTQDERDLGPLAKTLCPGCDGDGYTFTTMRDPEPFPTCARCAGAGWLEMEPRWDEEDEACL